MGLILVFIAFIYVIISTKAGTEIIYSLTGEITYRGDDYPDFSNTSEYEKWKILLNITIPIELKGNQSL